MSQAYPLSHIYQLTVPVTNYYGDDIFEQSFYFEGACPTKAQVMQVLQEKIAWNEYHLEEIPECAVELDTLYEVYSLVTNCQDFPYLVSKQVLVSNPVEHPKFGKQSISMHRLYVHKV